MQFWMTTAMALALSTTQACSPVLDWREFEPEGSGVVVAFPCRPDHHARSVSIAGTPTQMDMVVCAAGDATYALSFIDVADPARVGAAIADLRAVAAANLGSAAPEVSALQVRGMTPNTQAARLALAGQRPDGAPLQQQAAFFSKGLRVYQASVVGARLSAEATETFFGSLKLPS